MVSVNIIIIIIIIYGWFYSLFNSNCQNITFTFRTGYLNLFYKINGLSLNNPIFFNFRAHSPSPEIQLGTPS